MGVIVPGSIFLSHGIHFPLSIPSETSWGGSCLLCCNYQSGLVTRGEKRLYKRRVYGITEDGIREDGIREEVIREEVTRE